MKPLQPSQTQWAPQCEAAPASGLGAPLQKEGGFVIRAGQQVLRECGDEGLTCQHQQQLPQAMLVQIQSILLPASFLLLHQRHQVI